MAVRCRWKIYSFVNSICGHIIRFSLYPLTDIWLIGDSLITHLHDMAEFRGSLNLGIPSKRVVWLGTRGMHWEQLRPKFQLMMIQNFQPVMILIHLGGNDLASVKQAKLMRMIKWDIGYIASVFPSTQIVWSDILPRRSWRGVEPSTTKLYKLIKRESVLIGPAIK